MLACSLVVWEQFLALTGPLSNLEIFRWWFRFVDKGWRFTHSSRPWKWMDHLQCLSISCGLISQWGCWLFGLREKCIDWSGYCQTCLWIFSDPEEPQSSKVVGQGALERLYAFKNQMFLLVTSPQQNTGLEKSSKKRIFLLVTSPGMCSLCRSNIESVEHIFLHCS